MSQDRELKSAEAQLDAVRKAYWAWADGHDSEFYILYDALANAKISQKPTLVQVRSLFMMLPGNIIGQGIAWGFNDTEVRESVHSFVEKNRAAVVASIAASGGDTAAELVFSADAGINGDTTKAIDNAIQAGAQVHSEPRSSIEKPDCDIQLYTFDKQSLVRFYRLNAAPHKSFNMSAGESTRPNSIG